MWFFDCPEIIYGEDALGELEELNGERAFIVTDPVLHELGFTDRIASLLKVAGLEVAHFNEVEPEPSLQTVQRGAEQMRGFKPDWIIVENVKRMEKWVKHHPENFSSFPAWMYCR